MYSVGMRTSIEEERAEQERWPLLPQHAGYAQVFDRLIAAEFAEPAGMRRETDAALVRVLGFAAENVPYYARLFRTRGIDPAGIGGVSGLPAIPVLTKQDLLAAGNELLARKLPPGDGLWGWFSSSGTTGRPARVLQTGRSNLNFTFMVQRRMRWHRFDPQGTLATIRLASQAPVDGRGKRIADGAHLRLAKWLYAGTFFQTGPHLFFNVTNPVEQQLEWLARMRPDYVQAYSESLEHLVLACNGEWPAKSVRKFNAISEQLTPSMRRLIERATGAPVEQGYGLNEIGIVATRCAAGRYHVHLEHCIVEIVDADGMPCAEGQAGRVVVTALCNAAMPLLRYDTGDVARAADGPCPCGRTLPAFGEIVGRYSRIAFLPEGTLGRVGALREALETMPPRLAHNLRQFQVHQFRDGRFELRLVTAGPLAGDFDVSVRQAWAASCGTGATALDIVLVDAIPRSPGGKYQDFTSDFVPRPDTG
jgi:phenylacetate-CoA ligase